MRACSSRPGSQPRPRRAAKGAGDATTIPGMTAPVESHAFGLGLDLEFEVPGLSAVPEWPSAPRPGTGPEARGARRLGPSGLKVLGRDDDGVRVVLARHEEPLPLDRLYFVERGTAPGHAPAIADATDPGLVLGATFNLIVHTRGAARRASSSSGRWWRPARDSTAREPPLRGLRRRSPGGASAGPVGGGGRPAAALPRRAAARRRGLGALPARRRGGRRSGARRGGGRAAGHRRRGGAGGRLGASGPGMLDRLRGEWALSRGIASAGWPWPPAIAWARAPSITPTRDPG